MENKEKNTKEKILEEALNCLHRVAIWERL